MKRFILAAVVVLTASSAIAADRSFDDSRFGPAAASSGWSGAYAGIFAGYNHVGYGWSAPGFGDFSGSIDEKSGGAFIGYNFKHGQFIYGVEADGERVWGSADFAGVPGALFATAEREWTTRIRARLGWDMGTYMPYIFGGASWTSLSTTVFVNGLGNVVREDVHHGYVAGAGIDAMLSEKTFARLEYGYADYNDIRHNFCPPAPCDAITGADSHSVRVGIGVKF